MERSHYLGAALFASIVGLSITLNHTSSLNAQASLPVNEFTTAQVAAGVTLSANAHNFFTCNTGGEVSVDRNPLGNARFWVYEFTGNEPPFDGEFFISPGEVAVTPGLSAINTLETYTEGRRYYVMSQNDIFVQCGLGISMIAICGDNEVHETEECDDGNTESNDGCSATCEWENICGDSDGSDYFTKGEVIGHDEFGNTYNKVDTCNDSNLLVERVCNGAIQTEETYDCPNGCLGGSCIPSICGNESIEDGEQCDDGNVNDYDGCSGECTVETGYECEGEPSGCNPIIPELPGGSSSSQAQVTCPTMMGDTTLDSFYAPDDVLYVVNYINGATTLNAQQFACADINGDDEVTASDAEAIIAIINAGNTGDTGGTSGGFSSSSSNSSDVESSPRSSFGSSVSNTTVGSLFVTEDIQPLRQRQLLGGTLGEPIFKLQFYAKDEAIDVTRVNFINATATESLDRLELYREGEVAPFAHAVKSACDNLVSAGNIFCAEMLDQQFVVPAGTDVDVFVRPRLRTDEFGATSGETVQIALIAPSNGMNAVEARGVTSGPLAQNDGDSTANGEIYIGTEVPGPNAIAYPVGNRNRTVLSKITNITNANPDANGTGVPTGVSAIGQFKFTAAVHENTKNGANDVVLDNVIFNVNATNVAIGANSFKVYNKYDQTRTTNCQPFYLSGDPFSSNYISGTFIVKCKDMAASIVDTEIDEGTDETIVLEADIVNPNVAASNGGESFLQVSLQKFDSIDGSYANGTSHIEWLDQDGSGNTRFEWIEYPETTIKSTSYNS